MPQPTRIYEYVYVDEIVWLHRRAFEEPTAYDECKRSKDQSALMSQNK